MINGTNGIGATNGINYTGALTPDALMMYCATRLRSLDDQMSEQFAKQHAHRASTSAVNNLQQRIHQLSVGKEHHALDANCDRVADQAIKAEVEQMFQEALNTLPAGPQKDALEKEFAEWNKTMGDKMLGKDEATNMAQRLGTISKDLSSSAELDMIQLQSLMSQRQTAIQLCTNLVSALGESAKTIAQKIGA